MYLKCGALSCGTFAMSHKICQRSDRSRLRWRGKLRRWLTSEGTHVLNVDLEFAVDVVWNLNGNIFANTWGYYCIRYGM